MDNIYLIIVLVVIAIYFAWRLKMATLNINQIEDFSELGQDYYFKCNDKIYSIPPIPPFVAKKLIRSGRDFSRKVEIIEEKIKMFQIENEKLSVDEQKPVPSDLLEESGSFYDFQINFIITSGIMEINTDGNKINDVTVEDINGSEEKNIKGWSTQLVMKIFKKINDIISVEQEKKS